MATTERDLRRRLRPPARRTGPRVPTTRDIGVRPVRQTQTAGATQRTPGRFTGGQTDFRIAREAQDGQFVNRAVPVEQFLGGAGEITPISPSRTLRGTQILPGTTGALPAVTQQAGAVSQAAGAIPAFQGIAAPQTTGLPGFQGVAAPTALPVSQDVTQARQLTSQALQGAMDLPSRQELAGQTFQNLLEQAEDTQTLGVRNIGQEAARLGRLGSGGVTTSLGDLNLQLQRGLQQEARGLAAETAGQTLADQLAQLQAGTGAAQALQGIDLSRAGFEQGLRGEARGELGREFEQGLASLGAEQALRGEARGERAAGLEAGLANLGAQTGALGALRGLEGQRFGQEAALRGELRGERGFQDLLAREAQQNIQNQLALENALLGQAGSFGFGSDPTGALLSAGQQQQLGAGQSAAGAAALAQALGQFLGQR